MIEFLELKTMFGKVDVSVPPINVFNFRSLRIMLPQDMCILQTTNIQFDKLLLITVLFCCRNIIINNIFCSYHHIRQLV